MFGKYKNLLVLIVRIIIGGIFIIAGWLKLSDMAMTVMYFGQSGLAPFWAHLVSYVEVVGGALVVLGLFVDLASLVLAIIMVVAIYVSRSMGLAGVELPLAVLAGLVGLAASGAGRFALDSLRKR